MRVRKFRHFVGDFETTVYEGQTSTEVWASASVELFTEDVHIFHSIAEQYDYFLSLDSDIICYYHNLKFDGNFWLYYLLVDLSYEQAYERTGDSVADCKWLPLKDMKNKSVSYVIADTGQWYKIVIKANGHIIELRDSLKLLPFSVKRIGDSFKTKHHKLEMEYTGFRYAGCVITDEEKEYIANDILVVKEALEIMFTEGHKKLTIGSCCLAEYKRSVGAKKYKELFPYLYDIQLPEEYGERNAADWIRRAYKGGWCYVAKGKENKIYTKGVTADVNSLYPSMMSSESGNIYPVGEPVFWFGNYIPNEALNPLNYYFIRIKTKFRLKEGKLPFVQVKHTYMYRTTEMLETSDIYNPKTKEYCDKYYDINGNLVDAVVTLTLTMTDYKLFLEHYDTENLEIISGCYFSGAIGIFDEYIEKYKQLKITSTGARRELAKLFLNNLYGKMATNTQSNFKIAFKKENGALGFFTCLANDKLGGYIACGAAITSYARNFTIRAAQKNYHGKDKPGFIYADTDSIHCDLDESELKGIKIDDKNFCCWKIESHWDWGYFLRQKTYIEFENGEYNVKCAGMPEKCKKLLIKSMEGDLSDLEEYSEEEQKFIKTKRTIYDIKTGLCVPGKLLPKRIVGGVLLTDTTFEIR